MNEEKWVKFWIVPFALAVLLLISVFDLPYGFYTVLRVCVCFASLYLAFCCYCCDGKYAIIPSLIIAVIWNPIFPVYLDKDTWVALDIIAMFVECGLGFYTYKLWQKS